MNSCLWNHIFLRINKKGIMTTLSFLLRGFWSLCHFWAKGQGDIDIHSWSNIKTQFQVSWRSVKCRYILFHLNSNTIIPCFLSQFRHFKQIISFSLSCCLGVNLKMYHGTAIDHLSYNAAIMYFVCNQGVNLKADMPMFEHVKAAINQAHFKISTKLAC